MLAGIWARQGAGGPDLRGVSAKGVAHLLVLDTGGRLNEMVLRTAMAA